MTTLAQKLAQFSPSNPADLIRKTSNGFAKLIEDVLGDMMMSGAFPAPGNRQLDERRFSITLPKNVDELDVVNVLQSGAMDFWISAALAFWSMCKHMDIGKEDLFAAAEADFNRDLEVLMIAFEAIASAGRGA